MTADGVAVLPPDNPGDEHVAPVFDFNGGDGEHGFGFNVQYFDGGSGTLNLPNPDVEYSVVIDTGTQRIKNVEGWASEGAVSRSFADPDHKLLTVTAHPAHFLHSCLYDDNINGFACPYTAAAEDEVNWLSFVAGDGFQWYEGDASDGVYVFTNVDVGGQNPPNFIQDTGTLLFELQNSHRNAALETFHGEGTIRLPNAYVRELWGVPDPATMTSTSLAATLGSGTGTIDIAQESGNDAMVITLSDVTFSKRKLKVTLGTITPTRPKVSTAKRTTANKAKVTFSKAKPRGAKVRGYQVKCVAGKQVVTAKGKLPAVVVPGLSAGRGYDCRVRALSKAGAGKYSKPKHLAARP